MKTHSTGPQPSCPYELQYRGRVGRIKFWPTRKIYGTYFRKGRRSIRNSFSTFGRALSYLKREFEKCEAEDRRNVALRSEMSRRETYHELEALLQDRIGSGVTLHEVVEYYLAHSGAEAMTSSHQRDTRG